MREFFQSTAPGECKRGSPRHPAAKRYKAMYNLIDRFNAMLTQIKYPFKTAGPAGKLLTGYVSMGVVNAFVRWKHDHRERMHDVSDYDLEVKLREFCLRAARTIADKLGPTPTGEHTTR